MINATLCDSISAILDKELQLVYVTIPARSVKQVLLIEEDIRSVLDGVRRNKEWLCRTSHINTYIEKCDSGSTDSLLFSSNVMEELFEPKFYFVSSICLFIYYLSPSNRI